MEAKIEEIRQILNKMTSYRGIPADDIPDIALYMDQVTTFMDRKLDSFKRNEGDKILTKTMINNYTKAKLTFPPINKKYEKEHIMLLTLIYHMKQIISVNDMAKLLDPIINLVDDKDKNTRSAEELYEIFTNMESEQLDLFEKSVEGIISDLTGNNELMDISGDAFMIIMVLTLIIQAERRKNLAEKLIDRFFLSKPDEKEKKKEDEKPKDKNKSKGSKKQSVEKK